MREMSETKRWDESKASKCNHKDCCLYGTAQCIWPNCHMRDEQNSGTAAGATHYQGSVQLIECLQAAMSEPQFLGYLQGNIIKYAYRLGKKGPALTDARKIRQYAEWLVQAIEGKTIDPRA